MGKTKTPAGVIVMDAWRQVNASVTNHPAHRSPLAYINVLRQFDVENNPRYQPGRAGRGETYCNIFVWDVTFAMGTEIPHWVDGNGNSCPVGKGRELSANGICEWLLRDPALTGWHPYDATGAQENANAGRPTVAAWRNPSGIGHIAMVMPGTRMHIAQAGKNNLYDVPLSRGFGDREVKFYGAL